MTSNQDEGLSHTTARLSISKSDVSKGEILEFLKSTNEKVDDSLAVIDDLPDNLPSDANKNKNHHGKRRRRSSAAPLNGAMPPTKVKHKKKFLKSQMLPTMTINCNIQNMSIFNYGSNFRDLIINYKSPNLNNRCKWITLTAPDKIPKLVVVLASGLEAKDISLMNDDSGNKWYTDLDEKNLDANELKFIHNNFTHVIKSRAPGCKDGLFSPIHALTHMPISKKKKDAIIEESKKTKITLNDLLISPEVLQKYGYPIDLKEGYRQTETFEHEGSHTFALDCEFCKGESGNHVLTRISIVNFQNEVVYDSYIKPKEKIIDYVTKYSGITEEILADVTTTLENAQDTFLKLISANDILIGHSLESDLNVLHIKHDKIIDTALIYEHPRGAPARPGLKWLTTTYLKRDIQLGEIDGSGHSSVEDAKACLDLVKLKLQEGSYFGRNLKEEFLFDQSNINGIVIDYGNAISENEYKINISNDDEAITQLGKNIDNYDVFVIKLRELEFARGWDITPNNFNKSSDQLNNSSNSEISKLNHRIQKLYDILPDSTLFALTSCNSDPREMQEMINRRKAYQNAIRNNQTPVENWDLDFEKNLKQLVQRARSAITFIKLKPEKTSTPESEH